MSRPTLNRQVAVTLNGSATVSVRGSILGPNLWAAFSSCVHPLCPPRCRVIFSGVCTLPPRGAADTVLGLARSWGSELATLDVSADTTIAGDAWWDTFRPGTLRGWPRASASAAQASRAPPAPPLVRVVRPTEAFPDVDFAVQVARLAPGAVQLRSSLRRRGAREAMGWTAEGQRRCEASDRALHV